jgi:prepilin signal peptidase PulO-like enzyme (type II secretory pathway)
MITEFLTLSPIISSVFIFAFGAIIGSFLNVVILRYNTGRSVNGRSGCMKCDYKLRWYDLIPIFSWLALKGRCRKCKSKISPQYPLVELATGLLFLGICARLTPLLSESLTIFGIFFVWDVIMISILVVIFVYDIYHKIIPNELSYTFAVLAFGQSLFLNLPAITNGVFETSVLLDLSAGLIFFIPFWALWFVSKGTWIGLGDGKLALGIGWFLGFVYGLSALVLAFWIGAIFSVGFLLIDKYKSHSRNVTMKTEIPFAPFLIIGLLIEFFVQIDVIGIGILF